MWIIYGALIYFSLVYLWCFLDNWGESLDSNPAFEEGSTVVKEKVDTDSIEYLSKYMPKF